MWKCVVVLTQLLSGSVFKTPSMSVARLTINLLMFLQFAITHTGWRKKNACFFFKWVVSACDLFLWGYLKSKFYVSKTSYSRRSEIFPFAYKFANCATRNVSKCDTELLRRRGSGRVCTARRTPPSFLYNFPVN
jgi:hypothetical protein